MSLNDTYGKRGSFNFFWPSGKYLQQLTTFSSSELTFLNKKYYNEKVISFVKRKMSCHIGEGGRWGFKNSQKVSRII